jgi:Gnt-I system high-affinity gluconate transporter
MTQKKVNPLLLILSVIVLFFIIIFLNLNPSVKINPLLVIIYGIALLLAMTLRKISPFLALLIVALVVGLLLNMPFGDIVKSVEKGVGSTLASLALILSLGAVLGKMLEKSGAAQQISDTLISSFGIKNIQWAIVLTGFLVGIPLFYNAGFVILVPLVFSIAINSGLPLLYIAIPMAASLSTTHAFLPPHPGPAALVSVFKADLGKTLVYGLILAVPLVIIAGPFLGRILKRIKVEVNHALFSGATEKKENLPGVLPSFMIALMPVILITLAVVVQNFVSGESLMKKIILFTGDATIALLLSVLFATYYFGIRTGKKMEEVMQWLNDAISGIAVILLIISAGGVFKQVLIDSGTGTYITSLSTQWQMSPLIFGWLVAALLRLTLGSATVAGITAAGIVSPLIASGVSPELMVLSVGAGSIFFSHVNDTGFWMFKEFFNLSLKQTFLSWSLMETIISVLGLLGVLLLQALL